MPDNTGNEAPHKNDDGINILDNLARLKGEVEALQLISVFTLTSIAGSSKRRKEYKSALASLGEKIVSPEHSFAESVTGPRKQIFLDAVADCFDYVSKMIPEHPLDSDGTVSIQIKGLTIKMSDD